MANMEFVLMTEKTNDISIFPTR